MKISFRILLIAFIACIVLVVLSLGLPISMQLVSNYHDRYVACEPRKVTQILEQLYGLRISPMNQDIKAAMTGILGGAPPEHYRSFIIKFHADPNKLNESLNSLSLDEPGEESEKYKYSQEKDNRDRRDRDNFFGRTPKWFLTPIKKGLIYEYQLRSQDASLELELYVEPVTTDEDLVYIKGLYEVTNKTRKLDFHDKER